MDTLYQDDTYPDEHTDEISVGVYMDAWLELEDHANTITPDQVKNAIDQVVNNGETRQGFLEWLMDWFASKLSPDTYQVVLQWYLEGSKS